MSDLANVIKQLKDNKEQNTKTLHSINKNVAAQTSKLTDVIRGTERVVDATEEVVRETRSAGRNTTNAQKGLLSGVGAIIKNDIGGGLKSLTSTITGPLKSFVSQVPGIGLLGKIAKTIGGNAISASKQAELNDEEAARNNRQESLMQSMVDGISDLKDSFLKGLAKAGGMGLGVIAGLIAAPIIAIVAFFKTLAVEFKALTSITKSLAGGKLFAPIRLLFKGLTSWTKGLVRIADMVTKGSVSKIGGVLGKVFGGIARGGRSLAGFFSKIGKVVMRGINFIVNIGRRIVSFFSKFSSFAKGFSGPFRLITKFAAGFGTILGKIFLPITILMSAFDFITGFMDGYSEGGIIGGLEGGLSKLFSNLIGMPLDLLKSAVSWIAGVFGFDGVSAALDSFSFATLITDLIAGIFDGVKGVFSFLGDLFTWPTSFGDAFGKLVDIVMLPLTLAINFVKGLFGWGDPNEPFTFSGLISDAFTAAKDWIVGIFSWGTEGIANSDWGFMTPVKDAFASAIAWVKGIFSWGAEGPTVKGGITKFIDIVLAPYNLAVNWLMGLFGFSTPDGEPFSIGKVVMGAFTAAKDWIVGLFAWGKDAGTNAAGDFSFLTLVTGVFKSVKEWFTGIFSFSTPDGESFSIVTMLVDSAKKIFDWFKGLFDIDIGSVIKDYIPGWVMKWLPDSLFSGDIVGAEPVEGKAKGGPVRAGQPYLIGEQGAELFVPSQDGQILSNSRTNTLLASSSENASNQRGGNSQPIIINKGGNTSISSGGGGTSFIPISISDGNSSMWNGAAA